MVAVDPYVTGDFTTISEAVAAAPDNSVANDGYAVIYAVNVSMKTPNLMLCTKIRVLREEASVYCSHSCSEFADCDLYRNVDFILGLQIFDIYQELPVDKMFNAITYQGRTDQCIIVATEAANDFASSKGTTKKTQAGLGRNTQELLTCSLRR
ncbi:PREDICTED: probable pectinesterase/pectinesterase inhibitor 34 [Populus euphratica]|uniref:Probable pectinesterase/pectinesterase inhibitor 34 n=1 Tax=Populus euphratica TaxID=75702 RepID=A0AAJ6XZG4_POPEU|nr:PREDICTED: probable pectinesterase/pectinesterase inhibitor 34 [Populus euphratica]